MTTEGALGHAPDWYVHIRAARYLGVAPWELADQPLFWRQAALIAEAAENDAQEHRNRQSGG